MSIRQHDFTIERRFSQSPDQTFQAFADPDLRRRWFRVPDSWTDTEWSLDFRVGGGELNAGRDDRGTHHLFRSRFHDIVVGERIVFAYDMLLEGRLTSVSLACESIPLIFCAGRVLVEPFEAHLHLPGFDQSAMDGYAVCAADMMGCPSGSPVAPPPVGSASVAPASFVPT